MGDMGSRRTGTALGQRIAAIPAVGLAKRGPTAIDLFSGCGGLTLGLRQAGFRVLAGLDSDPLAVHTYRLNHRGIPVWERDIRQVPVSEVRATLRLHVGELDLLAGCPPCQGFSTIRTLNGRRSGRDKRNNLIIEFLRFVRGLRPRAVMLENVPGLVGRRHLDSVCRGLSRLGFSWEYRLVDAADFGVPQRRKRLILLASRTGWITFPKLDSQHRTVRDAIASCPSAGSSGDMLHDIAERRSGRIMAMIRSIPKSGGSRLDLGPEHQLKCHSCGFDGFKDVYGRMAWDRPAPTITGGCSNPSKGRFLHPRLNRAITLREAALLQSFPSRYRFSLSEGKYRAADLIGNALPPEFVRRHGLAVRHHLRRASVR